jgi:hypothetical protein
LYSDIDVHRELWEANLVQWLVHGTNEQVELIEDTNDVQVWEAVTGDTIRIDTRGQRSSIVTITQHDGRTFRTAITTREVT